MKGRFVSLFGILAVASMGATSYAADKSNAGLVDYSDGLNRAEMAVELLGGEGSSFTPPACVAGSEMFTDVPASSPFCSWIQELARRGVTGGCGPTTYCPTNPVTRDQMAVFIVRGMTSGGTARSYITRTATSRPENRIGTWTVSRPAASPTGVYCMTVTGASITTEVLIPSVEWGASLGFDLLAYALRTPFQCPAGSFEVRTYQFAAGGTPVLSNQIEFLAYIP